MKKGKNSTLLIIEGNKIYFNKKPKEIFPKIGNFDLIKDESIFKNNLFPSFLCMTEGKDYDVTVYKKESKGLVDYLKTFYQIPTQVDNVEFLIVPLRYSLRGLPNAYCLYPLKIEKQLDFFQKNIRK